MAKINPDKYKSCDPAVKRLVALMNEDDITIDAMSAKAGVGKNAMYQWRTRDPMISNLRACLNACGYDLAVVPLDMSGFYDMVKAIGYEDDK
ncbi:MAG: hypothetical protein CML17_02335 [Pusillimonas sp.]|nr:hypothetical protein [Pusillimonas sp.]|tara:strand:+ start:3798 stop:4073 length:276 start_codon:yes stop_codon:yes gene_type:complete